MTRRALIVMLVLIAALAGGGYYLYRLSKRHARVAGPSAASERAAKTQLTAAALVPAQGATSNVVLYFPSFLDDKLVAENRPMILAQSNTDRIRQILLALIEGSRKGFAPALPPSTTVRAVFLTADGAAYLDFSRGSLADFPPGIESETLAVYSIVDSLAANIPAIKQVKFLVHGEEASTLAGHVDLTGFFVPDPAWIEQSQ